MFLPLPNVLRFHSAACDGAAFVKQPATILTFTAEIGERSMLFQRQTLFSSLVTFMLWIARSTLLSMPPPLPTPTLFSHLRRAWVTLLSMLSQRHSCSQYGRSLQLAENNLCRWQLIEVKLYLYGVGCEAVPQWEDPLVSDNLDETVSNSSEIHVDSTEMRKASALRLQGHQKGKWTVCVCIDKVLTRCCFLQIVQSLKV